MGFGRETSMSEAKEKAWREFLAENDRDLSTREAFEAGWDARKLATFEALKDAKCPHCRGEGTLGLEDEPDCVGPTCTACNGFGKGSGCTAFDPEVADKRAHKR